MAWPNASRYAASNSGTLFEMGRKPLCLRCSRKLETFAAYDNSHPGEVLNLVGR